MRPIHPRLARRAMPVLAAIVALLAIAPSVMAHADLVMSDPADKAVLDTPPTTITLTFSEGLQASKSSFKVTGPDGDVGTGKAAADGDTVMTLGGLTLGAGAYAIEWTSAAQDGDIERGTLSFTVSEPPPAPATESPVATPSAVAPSQAATASAAPSIAPTPAPTPAPDPAAASTTDVVLPIVAGLAIAGLIGFLVLRRNRAA